MAKDKSKKKDTSSSEEEFAKPSEATGGGDGWKLTDAKNRLLLFKPLREETKPAYGKAGKNGETQQVIVSDVVVLTNKKGKALAEPEEHDEVWIFQGYVKGSLRSNIGERLVLGVLRNTEDTTGAKSEAGGYYYELEDASPEQIAIATAYRKSLDVFSQKKGAKKSKPADEKPAKGKKSKPAPEPEKKSKDKGKKKK